MNAKSMYKKAYQYLEMENKSNNAQSNIINITVAIMFSSIFFIKDKTYKSVYAKIEFCIFILFCLQNYYRNMINCYTYTNFTRKAKLRLIQLINKFYKKKNINNIESVITERINFYNSFVPGNKPLDIKKITTDTIEELQNIILSDINNDSFVQYSENSPLILIGFDNMLILKMEIINNYNKLYNIVSKMLYELELPYKL